MMDRIERRGAELAALRAAAARERVAAAARDALPGVAVGIEGEDVVLRGRALRLRAITDPVLRWIGGWLR